MSLGKSSSLYLVIINKTLVLQDAFSFSFSFYKFIFCYTILLEGVVMADAPKETCIRKRSHRRYLTVSLSRV